MFEWFLEAKAICVYIVFRGDEDPSSAFMHMTGFLRSLVMQDNLLYVHAQCEHATNIWHARFSVPHDVGAIA